MSEPILELNNVQVSYGEIRAVKGVSLRVFEREIVGLLGPNGAGKSSTLKAVSGLIRPSAGTISLFGQRIEGLPAHAIVKMGLVLVPEGRLIVPHFTVRENLLAGAFTVTKKKVFQENLDYVLQLFPILGQRLTQSAGTLSGGEQQMLCIGRALMSSPRVLLLDEPSLGLAPVITEKIFEVIKEINRGPWQTTVLLVEQNAFEALEITSRAYILRTGELVMEGESSQMLADPEIRSRYFGA